MTTAERMPAQSPLDKPQQARDRGRDRVVDQSFSPGYPLVPGSITGRLDMRVLPPRAYLTPKHPHESIDLATR